ncbi:MAG: MBOAT family O-acyltransferase [Acidimicrobiales bacterium]
MVFNSLTFAVFFIVFFAMYWAFPPRWRTALLLVGSYIFYGWWDWRFLSLIALSTVVDYSIGLGMKANDHDERVRRRLLLMSLVVNLGILGIFKYSNFFVDSFRDLLGNFGYDASDDAVIDVLLPVGISFYTFQTLSYTFDVYRRRIEPRRNLLIFGTYVAYFPQLVAGPIERAQNLLPRIEDIHRPFPNTRQIESGLGLILLGLVRKVVLADGAGRVANAVFDDPGDHSWVMIVIGILAFAVQIYGDFAGYTDIARGVSRLLGIELVVNFRQPYLSRNITEFWRRWHISLSDWLRDYLYISLGGNRKGVAKTYRNLMITMLLGGLWHGASWNFVIWGGLHGLYLVIHKYFRAGRVDNNEPTRRDIPAIALTFVVVALTWVPFRAATLSDTIDVFEALGNLDGILDWGDVALVLSLSTVSLLIDLAQRRVAVDRIRPTSTPIATGALLALAVGAIVLFSGGTPQPFIYFQF